MTGPNPIFEAVRREARTAEHDVAGWFHRDNPAPHGANPHPENPAATPATMAPVTAGAVTQQEDSMSLATIEDDVKTDLTQGLDWLEGFVGRVKAAAPGIIATSEAVGGSTVSALVEAVAGRILPPQMESVLAGIVKDFVDKYAPAQVQAAAPAQPAAAPVQ